MAGEKMLTKHPLGKSGKNMNRKNYNKIRKQRTNNTESHNRLSKKLKGKFSGNVSWYGETVKLDLEARKMLERTSSKPQNTGLKGEAMTTVRPKIRR
jgi:hypothetical protein